jgi:Flp pilus assembly protein TadD
MASAVIGRLLVASLHQAISEILPNRLEFYESWLSSKGFRAQRASLAGMRAVFSFLRQEGEAYHAVMRRTGEIAAAWQFESLSPMRRAWLQALPRSLRFRAALGLARRLVDGAWDETRSSRRWRRGVGTLTVRQSLFCDVREATPDSLCDFYAAVTTALVEALGLAASVRIDQCQARGDDGCVVMVTPEERGSDARVLAGLVLAAVLVAGGAARAQSPVPAARERVLVMPFDNVSREAKLGWLGEGSSILLADALQAAGIDAMGRDERLRAFERLQVPPLATLSRATVIRIGELVGAADVVIGSMSLENETLVLRARRIRLGTGRLDHEVVARGAIADLFVTYARLGAALWGRTLEASDAPAQSVPLAAFEKYVRGLLAETPAAQAASLTEAIRIQPAYDAARLALWQAFTVAGDARAAIEAVTPVADGSPVAIEARFLEAVSLIDLREYGKAFTRLASLQERAPSALVLNNMGVVRLRSGAATPDGGRPAWYFSQARTLDPLDPDYLFNLGYAYWLDGDPAAAGYWLREAVRLAPTDGGAHALLAQVLFVGGQSAEAARELALAQRLSSAFDGLELKAGAALTPPRGLERLKASLEPPRAERIDAALEMVGQRDQRELAAYYLAHGRRLFEEERDLEAESELTRALYLSPYDAEAQLLLGRVYLRTGRVGQAIDACKVSIWSRETAAARVVLAEAYLEAKDLVSARTEAERALALDPQSVHAQKLLERLRQPGRPV